MSPRLSEPEFVTAFTYAQRVVYGYIRALTPNAEAADEVFAETNLVLWRKRDEFEPGTNFTAWACTVARFQCLAYLERAGRDQLNFNTQLIDLLAEEGAQLADAPDKRLAALRHCLGEINPDHKQMLEQRYDGIHTVDQIAQSLGRSVNSISVTLHRLRHRLLNCIENQLTPAPGSVPGSTPADTNDQPGGDA